MLVGYRRRETKKKGIGDEIVLLRGRKEKKKARRKRFVNRERTL